MKKFNLSGFKPEPLESDNFVPFGGKYNVTVEESVIEDMPAGIRDNEAFDAYTRCKIKMAVVSAAKTEHTSNIGRNLWQSYNLDNEERVKKLAQLFFSVGLEFSDDEELIQANEKFIGKTLSISAWVGKDGRQAFKFVPSDVKSDWKETSPF
jgi:hypothetical protein